MDFHYTHYVLPEASVPKHGCKFQGDIGYVP